MNDREAFRLLAACLAAARQLARAPLDPEDIAQETVMALLAYARRHSSARLSQRTIQQAVRHEIGRALDRQRARGLTHLPRRATPDFRPWTR